MRAARLKKTARAAALENSSRTVAAVDRNRCIVDRSGVIGAVVVWSCKRSRRSEQGKHSVRVVARLGMFSVTPTNHRGARQVGTSCHHAEVRARSVSACSCLTNQISSDFDECTGWSRVTKRHQIALVTVPDMSPPAVLKEFGMNRTLLFATLSHAVGFAACGDDAGDTDRDAGTDTTVAPEGPAYEAQVEATGGPAEGTSSGQSEDAVQGQFYATVFEGNVDLFLTTGDATSGLVISAGVDTNGGEVPGSFSVTPTLEGSWFNVTYASATGAGSLAGQSGSISVDFCPNDVGAVVAGTFNDIGTLDDLTQADGGTFNGEFRATVVQSDGSVTCTTPVVDQDTGVDTGPGECSVDPERCTGPVCPYAEYIAQCFAENCFNSCQNPMEFEACFACTAQCEADSGIADDAEAVRLVQDLNACSEQSGCDELEDDEACLIANCCAEVSAAYN